MSTKRICNVSIILTIGLLLLSKNALSEPYAELFKYKGDDDRIYHSISKIQASEIPGADEVPFDKYPDSLIFSIDPDNKDNRNRVIDGLVLISKDSPGEVLEWYKNKIYFKTIKKTEAGTFLFKENIKCFDPNKDWDLLAKYSHLLIKEISPKVREMVPGYNSWIEVVYLKNESN